MTETVVPMWMWGILVGVLLAGLFVDLFAHRGQHSDTHRSAMAWAVFWIMLGLGFGGFVWWQMGAAKSGEYIAAYLIEKSLSVDNLFVFLIIFQSLRIGPENQRTVLSWGIFGALVFRLIFIFLGAEAIDRWHWVAYVFGAILIYAAWKIFREDPGQKEENKWVSWLSKRLPLTEKIHGHHFFVKEAGRTVGTPLLLAVLALELTDIMFAIDSVPAAFSISRDKFILYSSNAFAILGLRSLYMVLAKTISDLEYLHYGLAAVLAFAGVKLIISDWYHLPAPVSIGIIVVAIGASVVASLIHRKKHGQKLLDPPVGEVNPGHSESSDKATVR